MTNWSRYALKGCFGASVLEVLSTVPSEMHPAVDAWLAYLDRPDTNVIAGYWVTTGVVPS